MSLLLILVIIAAGIGLILLEFILTPGITLMALAGVAAIVFGLYEAHVSLDADQALVITIVSVIATVAAVFAGFKWLGSKDIAVQAEMTGKTNVIEPGSVRVGDKGKALSALRPSGKGMIGGKLFEIASLGEFIDTNSDIEVIQIEDNKIYVKQI